MQLFFSTRDTHKPKMKKMWYSLFEEFFTREMYWLFHADEYKNELLKKLLKIKKLSLEEKDSLCVKCFESNPDFKMRRLDGFNEDIKKKGIFQTVINIITYVI